MGSTNVTLWEIDVYPVDSEVDRHAKRIVAEAAELGVTDDLAIRTARGFLIEGDISADQATEISESLLADTVIESTQVATVGDPRWADSHQGYSQLIHVLPKPGVMDPTAQSTHAAIRDMGISVGAVRTFRKYFLRPLEEQSLRRLCQRVLANDSIEQVITGPLQLNRLEFGEPYQLKPVSVSIRERSDAELAALSRDGQLYLTQIEMQTIQEHFVQLDREPTDVELESIAQTWSEHCSHKTLAGRIAYRDECREIQFDNMLKETIFAATVEIRRLLAENDWCVSVFEDNAGVVTFDDDYHVVFKVETHNHPSALEPYGGANTGIGGVIRDPMGTGLGAKPICNTNVFCFAPPTTATADLPPGVLHPRRVMNGVVAGVRDYGNRMGIPTVNGAIYFDERYLGNPLVYCGNVGILPVDKTCKQPRVGDHIVSIGGRTGRDGIHGATFSSAELTSESETLSGGAVQIGNAITEKMVLDVLLQARDRGLFNAVTDCGAGGYSSAVGEMAADLGAEVWLDRVPLKYEGLTYTEIWISEAQERMVMSVPPENWKALEQLCDSHGVEATILGTFQDTGRLRLMYASEEVANLSMDFLHHGRPPIVRDATYQPPTIRHVSAEALTIADNDWTPTLLNILGSLNVASKEWVIRQYDHEVQGGSVVKPLVGIHNDGPSDAAVLRARLDSYRGLTVSCGMNPHYGDHDTYHMAASAIDEAIRNCVAVGADPTKIAILDNFCWGYTDRPETLGSLVRAALACRDIAISLQTPFISGKDSLNNEFSYVDAQGHKQTIAIPPTLLISALGQIADVRQCVTMDLKQAGNRLFLVGTTHDELGGSHFGIVQQLQGQGSVPQVDAGQAKMSFVAVHRAITAGLVRACHDLSEGGLGVAAAEMAFAGGLGAHLQLTAVNQTATIDQVTDAQLLFSESNSRFLCEVPAKDADEFRRRFDGVPCIDVGCVTQDPYLVIQSTTGTGDCIRAMIDALKRAWQAPLDWN